MVIIECLFMDPTPLQKTKQKYTHKKTLQNFFNYLRYETTGLLSACKSCHGMGYLEEIKTLLDYFFLILCWKLLILEDEGLDNRNSERD